MAHRCFPRDNSNLPYLLKTIESDRANGKLETQVFHELTLQDIAILKSKGYSISVTGEPSKSATSDFDKDLEIQRLRAENNRLKSSKSSAEWDNLISRGYGL